MSVKNLYPRIAIMHKLKERFQEIFENRKNNWLRGLLRIGNLDELENILVKRCIDEQPTNSQRRCGI